MSETKHSPEPWHYVGDSGMIEDDRGRMCAEGWGANDGDANARRLVACVNACAGIPTEALEAGALRRMLDAYEYLDSPMPQLGSGDEGMAAADAFVDAITALRSLGRLKP